MTSTTQVCKRCNGKGFLSHFVRIQAGDCFACNGTGWVQSKNEKAFHNAFSTVSGLFFGLSYKTFEGKTVKTIVKAKNTEIVPFAAEVNVYIKGSTDIVVTPITQEQAFCFFVKYGSRVTL